MVSCCRGGEARISVLHVGCCLKVGRLWSAIKFREGKGVPSGEAGRERKMRRENSNNNRKK